MALNDLANMFGAKPVREVVEEQPKGGYRSVPGGVEVLAEVNSIKIDTEKMQLKISMAVVTPEEYKDCFLFQNYNLQIEDNMPSPENFSGEDFRKNYSRANQLLIFLYETGAIDINRKPMKVGNQIGIANSLGRAVKFKTRESEDKNTGKKYVNPGFLYAIRTENTEFPHHDTIERFRNPHPKAQLPSPSGRIENDAVVYSALQKIPAEVCKLALEDRGFSDPLPEGTLVFGTVVKAEEGLTSTGKPCLKLAFTVRDEPKRRIFGSFMYGNETSAGQIASLFEACGIVDPTTGMLIPRSNEEIFASLMGKEVIFTVGIYGTMNTINSEFGPAPTVAVNSGGSDELDSLSSV